MRMTLAVLFNSLLILSLPAPLLAKAKTVKITIPGPELQSPMEISDPKLLANFQVWTGPGTSSGGGQGFIVDWSQGLVREALRSPRRYQVSFYAEGLKDQVIYVVYWPSIRTTSRVMSMCPANPTKLIDAMCVRFSVE
jgi:hypothetical protein